MNNTLEIHSPSTEQSSSLIQRRIFWILLYLFPLQFGLCINIISWGVIGGDWTMDGEFIVIGLQVIVLAIIASLLFRSHRPLSGRLHRAIVLLAILPPLVYTLLWPVGIVMYVSSLSMGLVSVAGLGTVVFPKSFLGTQLGDFLFIFFEIAMWTMLILPLAIAPELPKRYLRASVFVVMIVIFLSLSSCIAQGKPHCC